MFDERINFPEAALVQQQINSFARGQPVLGVLRVNPLLPAAKLGLLSQFPQSLDLRRDTHVASLVFE